MQTAEHDAELYFEWCGHATVRSAAGARVALPRKATALLAYLLIERGPHSRSHLSALLWPESDEVHAAMSLRQALSKLRDVLGDSLVADRQQVSLQRQEMPLATACDVHRFEALVGVDALSASRTDVHRFLDSLMVDDAPEFVHWCDRTRARLRGTAVQALSRLAEELRVKGDWHTLLDVGERWTILDPLSPDAVCTAIEAAFLRRDGARALAHRDSYRRTLAAEGLSQSAAMARVDELTHRYERLQRHTPVHGVPAVTITRDALDADVGALRERDHAWATIIAAFDEVRHSASPRWVTISGGVGSGRSRLLRDAITLLVQRGATVLKTESPPAASPVPFGVVAQLVRSVLHEEALAGIDESHLRTLHTLVPELADSFASLRRSAAALAGTDGPFAVRLQEALVQLLLALAEDRPVVLGLDDAMWYDRESAVALHAVSQRTTAIAALWLVTDADDVLQERENAAWAELLGTGERVTLAPLSVQAIEELLAELSGECEGWGSLAHALHDGSHGVPGSVMMVVRALSAHWGPPHRRWQEQALHDLPLAAPSARARAHIDALDDVTRTVLLSLALVMESGHPVSVREWCTRPALTPDQLSHMHGISRLRAAVVGHRLVEARLANEADGGFRCASPVIAGYLLSNGSAVVRDELRRLLVRLLAPRS